MSHSTFQKISASLEAIEDEDEGSMQPSKNQEAEEKQFSASNESILEAKDDVSRIPSNVLNTPNLISQKYSVNSEQAQEDFTGPLENQRTEDAIVLDAPETTEPPVTETSAMEDNTSTEHGQQGEKISVGLFKIGKTVFPYVIDPPQNGKSDSSSGLQDEADGSPQEEEPVEYFSFHMGELRATQRDTLNQLYEKRNPSSAPKQAIEAKVKAPEKWIVVLDTAKDNTSVYFESEGTRMNTFTMFKLYLKHVVSTKGVVEPNHQIALVTMNKSSSTWVYGYSTMNNFINVLPSVKACKPKETFNLNTVFDTIIKNDEVCKMSKFNVAPKYIVRVMFLYGRSNTIPKITMTDDISRLLNSSYFIFDVLASYVITDKSSKISGCLKNLDPKGHFFLVGRDTLALQSAICSMMVNPSKGALTNTANNENDPKNKI